IAAFTRRVFICARTPYLAGSNKGTPNLSSIHRAPMISNCIVREGNALLDLGGLGDVGQVQIVLSKSGPGQSKNGNTKSKWLKCFHIFVHRKVITLLRFSGVPLPDSCFSFAFTRQRKRRGELPLEMFSSPRLATLRHRRRS